MIGDLVYIIRDDKAKKVMSITNNLQKLLEDIISGVFPFDFNVYEINFNEITITRYSKKE